MPQKLCIASLVVVCITILIFTWMVRDSLCELHIKGGNTELAAILAYEVRR
ncbi:Hok/Gef family protein [Buttiauxella selenatireducens]|uniref:Hok/Gef family protein n=1 Tax=Buttiauxella selenatireducens TaxID=3073902 RepID=A0ABY9SHD8_9ENTR|nr:Hok/Gef family protein [Buttiauxella sp. R73]WMY76418.1 Hok/Gef family protein [Buttiauxella sp. R73]